MIEKIECEIIHCDGCGKIYENCWGWRMFVDVEHIAIKCAGWIKDENKHYCGRCVIEKGLVRRKNEV